MGADGRISPEELAAAAALLPSAGAPGQPAPAVDAPPSPDPGTAAPGVGQSAVPAVGRTGLAPSRRIDAAPPSFGDALRLPLRGFQWVWIAAGGIFGGATAALGILGPVSFIAFLAMAALAGLLVFLSLLASTVVKAFHATLRTTLLGLGEPERPDPSDWFAPMDGIPLLFYGFAATLPLYWGYDTGQPAPLLAIAWLWLIAAAACWPMAVLHVAVSNRFESALNVARIAGDVRAGGGAYLRAAGFTYALLAGLAATWSTLLVADIAATPAVAIVLGACLGASVVYAHAVLGARMAPLTPALPGLATLQVDAG